MNIWLTIAGFFGLLSVLAGSFGDHVLLSTLTDAQYQSYSTAIQYQMWHTLALLGVGIHRGHGSIYHRFSSIDLVGLFFVLGVLGFCGGIYLNVLTKYNLFNSYLIPAGGLAFIIGWLALIYYGFIGRNLNNGH